MSEQDANKERLELALEAAGLDLWENNLVTGDVPRKAIKTFAELGYSAEEAASYVDDIFKVIHPDDIPALKAAVNHHVTGVTAQYRSEFRLRAKDGAWVWYANYGRIMDRDNAHPGQRLIGVTFNIDDRKRKEDALAVRKQEWRALTENSPDTISRYDRDCRRIYANPAFGAVVDGGIAALIGKKPSECPGGEDSEVYEAKIKEVFANGRDVQFELKWPDKEGGEMCSQVRLTAERDAAGSVISVLGVGRDITELNQSRNDLKQANAQLQSMNVMLETLAFSDPLTQLPNRRFLLGRIQQALASSTRNQRRGALLFIDMDNFKSLNDAYGHDVGDLLLKQVAHRLKCAVREGDTVARIGGDEFVVMLEDLSEQPTEAAAQAETVGNKILAMLDEPYQLDRHAHRSSSSIGVTLFYEQEQDVDDLLKQADSAMYMAKKAGRNTLRFFCQD